MKRSSLFYLTLSLLLLFSADSLPVSSQSSPPLLVGQNTRKPLSNWIWDNLERILSELQRNSVGDNSLTRLVSFYFPPGFAKGQVALSVYGAGGIEYIVAREGVRIPGLSTARALSFAPSIPAARQISGNISGSSKSLPTRQDNYCQIERYQIYRAFY